MKMTDDGNSAPLSIEGTAPGTKWTGCFSRRRLTATTNGVTLLLYPTKLPNLSIWEAGEDSPWARRAWWGCSGATRRRGRSSTCCATGTTWWCGIRAGRTRGTRSSSMGSTYKLSLVPTGILRQGVHAVIGNGVVIHPPALLEGDRDPERPGGRHRRPAARERPGPCDPSLSP